MPRAAKTSTLRTSSAAPSRSSAAASRRASSVRSSSVNARAWTYRIAPSPQLVPPASAPLAASSASSTCPRNSCAIASPDCASALTSPGSTTAASKWAMAPVKWFDALSYKPRMHDRRGDSAQPSTSCRSEPRSAGLVRQEEGLDGSQHPAVTILGVEGESGGRLQQACGDEGCPPLDLGVRGELELGRERIVGAGRRRDSVLQLHRASGQAGRGDMQVPSTCRRKVVVHRPPEQWVRERHGARGGALDQTGVQPLLQRGKGIVACNHRRRERQLERRAQHRTRGHEVLRLSAQHSDSGHGDGRQRAGRGKDLAGVANAAAAELLEEHPGVQRMTAGVRVKAVGGRQVERGEAHAVGELHQLPDVEPPDIEPAYPV